VKKIMALFIVSLFMFSSLFVNPVRAVGPTVQTNSATGVEETNTTMQGTLIDDGGQTCEVDFQYGLDTSYGSDTVNQIKTTGQTFSVDQAGLSKGTLYHFRARANTSEGTAYGADNTFLTKPETISNLQTDWRSATMINLTWTNGVGGDGAYIEYANGSALNPWNPYKSILLSEEGPYTDYSDASITGGTVQQDVYVPDGLQIFCTEVNVYCGLWYGGGWYSGGMGGNFYLLGDDVGGKGIDSVYLGSPDFDSHGPTWITFLCGIYLNGGQTYTLSVTGWNSCSPHCSYYGAVRWFKNDTTQLYRIYGGGGIKINATGYIAGTSFNHTGVTNDTYYYYKLWPYAQDGGFRTDGTTTMPFGTSQTADEWVASPPVVQTDNATGVEEATAIMHGTLVNDSGLECEVDFQYGLSTSYGSDTVNQIKTTGQTFSVNQGGLSKGTLYHYRARATVDDEIMSYGADNTFLTKPETISNLQTDWTAVQSAVSRHEYTDATPNDYRDCRSYDVAQTFTIGAVGANETFYLDYVKTTCSRYLAYTTSIQCSLRETDGNYPIGGNLANATLTIDGARYHAISYTSTNFDASYPLQPGVKYALVYSSGASTYVWHSSSNPYSGGREFVSPPGGGDWGDPHSSSVMDVIFETYGHTLSSINFLWTNGVGGDGAYIEYAVGSPPYPWNLGSGTKVNATGYITGTSFNHQGLTNDTHYYYSLWPFAQDGSIKSNGSETRPFGTVQRTDLIIASNATISNPYPSDGAKDISQYVIMGITVENGRGYPMDIIWSSNVTGILSVLGINASVYDGRQSMSSYGVVESPHDVTIVYPFSEYVGENYTYNPCSGNDVGEITSVRIFTDSSFTPMFKGNVLGSEYTPVDGVAEITNDAQAPTQWTWSDIKNLDLKIPHVEANIAVTYDMLYGENLKIYWNVKSSIFGKVDQQNYSFTTEQLSPTISNPLPTDASTWLYLRPTLSVDVTEPQGHTVQVDFFTTEQAGNLSSGWTQIGSYSGGNETYGCPTTFGNYSQLYYWRVDVTDGTYTTSKTYRFTTRAIQVPPIALSATTVNTTTIRLTWSVDINTDYVMIKRRPDYYPSFSDPGFIYTGSATQFNDSFCSPGTLYYYRGWSYNGSDDIWSVLNTSTDAMTKPEGPTSLDAVAVSYDMINLTWNIGSGANTTLLYRRSDHYPTALGDGTLVYAGSGSSFSDTYSIGGNITYYYRGWSNTEVSFTAWDNSTRIYDWDSLTNSSDSAKTFVGPPTVLTKTPTSATEISMVLQALVISNGGDNATCGFYWGNSTSEEHNVTIGHYATEQTYSYPLSGLSVGTSHLVKTWGFNIHGFTKGNELVVCTLPAGPTALHATADSASSISLTWLKGIGADETQITYKTTGYPTSPSDGASAYFDTGLSTTLFGLAGNVTYYFRAWSYNNSGSFYSSANDSDSDTTPVGKPTVINYYPGYINNTEATLNGELTYDNGDRCTCGFQYGLSPGVYTHNVTMPGTYTTGQTFQFTVTDLTIATTWYYRSWANNLAGFSNSSEIMFVTRPVATTSFSLTPYGSRQFNMSWTKGQGADQTWILRKTTGYPANISDGDLRYDGNASSFIDKDWYPPLDNTLYFYRAWSYNVTNELYSNLYDSQSGTTGPLLTITNELPNDNATNIDRYVDFSIKVDGGTDPINVTIWNAQEFDTANRLLGDHAGGWSYAENDYSMPPYNGTKGGVLDYESGMGTLHHYVYNGYSHWYYQVHTAETWFSGTDSASSAKLWVKLDTPMEISGIQFGGSISTWTTGSGGNGTGTFLSTLHFEYHDYNKDQWVTASRVPIYGETDKLYTDEIVKVDEVRMWFTKDFIKDNSSDTVWKVILGHGFMYWLAFVPPMKMYNDTINPGDTLSFTSDLTLLNYTYCWAVTADDGIDHTYSKVYNFTTEGILLGGEDPREGELFNVTNPTHDCSVLVNHTGGDLMNVSFYTKADNGTYMLQTTYNNAGNGTYSFTYVDSGLCSKEYYWKVVANDSLNEYSGIYFFKIRDTYQPLNAQIETTSLNKTAIRLHNITRDNSSDTLLIRYLVSDLYSPFQQQGTMQPMGYPTNQTNGTFLMNGTASTFDHNGLQEWTQYDYSAWGWNATDGVYGSRYTFSGRTEGGQIIDDESPVDNTTGVLIYPMLKAYVSDFDFDLMNISINTNASGAWVTTLQQWTDVGDGWVETNATMADTQNTYYWWSVNATDNTYWTNQTFSFLTGSITPPLNFTATAYNSTQINLTWDKGEDANRVQIIRRTDHYPINMTDGTVVYNGTGGASLDVGLQPGVIGYYSGYGYNDSIHTWGYTQSQARDLTYPQPPTEFEMTAYTHRTLNFTWTQGIGANKTIIVGKYDFQPENATDGTIVYNGTLLSASHTGLKPDDYLSYLEPLTPGVNNMGVYPLGGEQFTNSTDGNESSKWDPDAGKNNQTFSYTFDSTRWYSTHLLISDFYHDPGATWNAGITKIEFYNGSWYTAWTGDGYSPGKQWFNYNVSTPWDIYGNVTQIRYTAWTQFIAPNVYEAKIGKLGFIYKYSAYSYTEMDGLVKVSLNASYATNRTKDTPFNSPPEFSGSLPVNGTITEPQPTLSINISDAQGQSVSLIWESNYTGTWQTIGTTASVHNETVTMPTTISFNTSVYWRVRANDGADVADSIFYTGTDNSTSPVYHFNTRKAYVEGGYNYTPANPTNDDTIQFEDLSKNATHLLWRIDTTTISEITYPTIIHPPFNLARKLNLSNVYNVTMQIENGTDAGYNLLTSKQINVDRNLTLLKTPATGINYVAYHLNGKTNSIAFANTFQIPDGWWIHRYNSTSKEWESYWVNQILNNFTINTWDTVVISGYDQRTINIPTTQYVVTHQTKTIPAGISYLVWSSATPTTLLNISIGLAAGDWIHVYDTQNNEWNSRWISYALVGKDIQIKPYDVFAVSVSAPRTINIG